MTTIKKIDKDFKQAQPKNKIKQFILEDQLEQLDANFNQFTTSFEELKMETQTNMS